ncbi:SDR family NAD(P)-dependent oxidoreductase (plasmid) [Rhizobium sp. TH2]|uniref:SDR family NAD(P)-dependent oxidoreductase n=1 Tax=Rhizobium sp. TH2 TaxID=2775403 RepID=UPI0021570610|nr:SDR family NAD(P)-dependent oxidoreductase [Rhizobium sp. TH2]UVC12505.1 SDR family NAD(P)-dependent oxidoreductase [Rhizobium sp. TH2]
MASAIGKLAVITGASSGIGFELAKMAAQEGYDLIIAADEPHISDAADELRAFGVSVESVKTDLATTEGVKSLVESIQGHRSQVELLMANAGVGLGHGFLDQDLDSIRHIINTNVTGTMELIHAVGNLMRSQRSGRILITGSIAGFMPGTFQAVYNGTKAYLNSFSFALRNELKDSGVTVTCLMPGATDTRFFERADMLDTSVGQAKKDDPADVARVGFDALMAREGDVVSGFRNKVMAAVANITPAEMLAEQHRKMAEPGSGKH